MLRCVQWFVALVAKATTYVRHRLRARVLLRHNGALRNDQALTVYNLERKRADTSNSSYRAGARMAAAAMLAGTSPPVFISGFSSSSFAGGADFGVSRGFARPKAHGLNFSSPISTLPGVFPAVFAGGAAEDVVLSGASGGLSLASFTSMSSTRSHSRSLSGSARGPSLEERKTGFEVTPASRAVGFRVAPRPRSTGSSPPTTRDGAFTSAANIASTGGLSKALADSALVRPIMEQVRPTLSPSLPPEPVTEDAGNPRPYRNHLSQRAR